MTNSEIQRYYTDGDMHECDSLGGAELDSLGRIVVVIEADHLAAIRDYEEVFEDKRRLVRELDVAVFGDKAAKQASLCDLVRVIPAAIREAREAGIRDSFDWTVENCGVHPADREAAIRALLSEGDSR